MTDTTPTPRSRRVLLTAALGAGAATVASALARPLAVQAANNDIVRVGHAYTASTVTSFDTGSTGHVALSGSSSSTTGVLGGSSTSLGVHGYSTSGTGVHGASVSGDGVFGSSTSGIGVAGISSSSDAGVSGTSTSGVGVIGAGAAAGVRGTTTGGVGVQGFSGPLPVSTASDKTGVFGYSAVDVHAIGVKGESVDGFGVLGVCNTNVAVEGSANTGTGVYGASNTGTGVRGGSSAPDKPAILGLSAGSSTGVQGFSGTGAAPAPTAKTGVFGYAVQDATAAGVRGQTTLGRGVLGIATSGSAVYGIATSGIGTWAYAATGTALHASTSAPNVGTAFRAAGKVKLDNCAGVATIASGASSVVVTPGIDLLATSAVVATLQGNPAGTTTVKSVEVNAAADTFTIHLTANATAAVTVAWHVFG